MTRTPVQVGACPLFFTPGATTKVVMTHNVHGIGKGSATDAMARVMAGQCSRTIRKPKPEECAHRHAGLVCELEPGHHGCHYNRTAGRHWTVGFALGGKLDEPAPKPKRKTRGGH